MDVTALHLTGNNLTRLTQSMFLGRSRLKKILVKQSNVHEIENGTFSGLDHLEIINLGYNQLKQLIGHEFIGAVSLRELYLEHNQLVTISKETFKHLTQLTVLRLDGNLLIGKKTELICLSTFLFIISSGLFVKRTSQGWQF